MIAHIFRNFIIIYNTYFNNKKHLRKYILLFLIRQSEEAQEARNKDLRNYRLYHSRKKGRIESNEDVMHNLLLSSDPFINSFRTKLKLKKLELPDEVKQLLKE